MSIFSQMSKSINIFPSLVKQVFKTITTHYSSLSSSMKFDFFLYLCLYCEASESESSLNTNCFFVDSILIGFFFVGVLTIFPSPFISFLSKASLASCDDDFFYVIDPSNSTVAEFGLPKDLPNSSCKFQEYFYSWQC